MCLNYANLPDKCENEGHVIYVSLTPIFGSPLNFWNRALVWIEMIVRIFFFISLVKNSLLSGTCALSGHSLHLYHLKKKLSTKWEDGSVTAFRRHHRGRGHQGDGPKRWQHEGGDRGCPGPAGDNRVAAQSHWTNPTFQKVKVLVFKTETY